MNLWFTLLYQPLVNALVFLYKILGQNFGWAIIGLTLALRSALLPLTLPSLKMTQKIKEIQPELEKLKKKHKNDKQGFAQAQLKLYQKHNINPASGCLPWIVQIVVLIALYRAFNNVLRPNGDMIGQLNKILYPFLTLSKEVILNTRFFYLDLTKPDLIGLPFKLNLGILKLEKIPGIFLIAAAATQFFSSKLMLPRVREAEKLSKKTPEKEDDMAVTMQKQMVYMMPLFTIFIGFSFPSGLVLYWTTFSAFMLIQQLYSRKKNSN